MVVSICLAHASLQVAPAPLRFGRVLRRSRRPYLSGAGEADTFWRRALGALPDDPDTCLLQMRAALDAALQDGHRRLCVDISVPALDAASRGFEAVLLARFSIAAAQACYDSDQSSGALPPQLLVHSLSTALEITKQARLCSTLVDEDGDPCVLPLGPALDLSSEHAERAVQYSESRATVIVGPFGGEAEHEVSRRARTAHGRAKIVLLNCRVAESSILGADEDAADEDATPSSSSGWRQRSPGALARVFRNVARRRSLLAKAPESFVVAFDLCPVLMRSAPVNDDPSAAPAALSLRERELVPDPSSRAVLCRRYPAPWALLVDMRGDGYVDAGSFDTRPSDEALLGAIRRVTDDGMLRDNAPSVPASAQPSIPRAPLPEQRAAPIWPALAPEIEAREWCELERGPPVEFGWYTAGVLLRMRCAPNAGNEQWDMDKQPTTVHLFAASVEGWRARPPRLAACALLLLDETAAGQARLVQLCVDEAMEGEATGGVDASGAEGRWAARLVAAAEGICAARLQTSLGLQVEETCKIWWALEQRGFERINSKASPPESQEAWLVKRLSN